MKVICAMLAPYAEIDANNHLHMIGGDIDRLSVPILPMTLTIPLYFGAKIVLTAEECGKVYQVRVEWVGPTGIIEQIESPFEPRLPELGMRNRRLGSATAFYNTTIPVAGEYHFRLLLDDNELANVPVHVFQESSATN